MILHKKTLEKLRNLINEETMYRGGPALISFFNDLGFQDQYGQGFPSRWKYTDGKLDIINGKPELDRCIKKLFSPIDYVGRFSELDKYIDDFNQYLAFDGWRVVRSNQEISFQHSTVNIDEEIRKAKGLTQAQLAEMVDLEITSISRIENGSRFPQKENIEKFVEALDCNIKDLFDFDYIKTRDELRTYIDKKLDEASLNDLQFYVRLIDAHLETRK